MKEAPKESELVKDSRDISLQCVDAVEISLFIEKEGLAFYEKAAKNALDSRVKDMFLRLAEEERIHIQTLQTKIQFLQPAISGKGKTRRRVDTFVSEEIKGKIFPTFELKAVNKFKNDVEALDYGIESEKRSIETLARLLENEKKLDVKAVFLHLMVEEKKHLALLEDLKKEFNFKTGVILSFPLLLGVVLYAGIAKKNDPLE